jgi:hypothetical protein
VPGFTYDPGIPGDLKVGVHVLPCAIEAAGGSWSANRINDGKEICPPM